MLGSPVSGGGGAAAAAAQSVELIDSIYVAANTTSVSFGTGGDGVNDAALDGDADFIYELECYWVPSALNSVRIDMVPNQLSSPITSQQFCTWARGRYPGYTSRLAIQQTYTTNNLASKCRVMFMAASGKYRMFSAREVIADAAVSFARMTQGSWEDKTTNITSLGLVCSTAGGILVGSEFHLYKRLVA